MKRTHLNAVTYIGTVYKYFICFIFRATKDFKVEFGATPSDLGLKTVVGTLSSVYTISDCTAIPMQTYEVMVTARYAKFTAVNYYGLSAGLQYIGFL